MAEGSPQAVEFPRLARPLQFFQSSAPFQIQTAPPDVLTGARLPATFALECSVPDWFCVRDACPNDCATIVAFNARLAEESEGRRLDPETLRLGVENLLREPSRGRYFLAEADGRIIGQAMITYEWSDWRNGMFWWLQSVYVLPEHRGRGVLRAIVAHLETAAAERPGVCGLRLYVDRHNHTARAAYHRLGLAPAGYEVLEKDFTPLARQAPPT